MGLWAKEQNKAIKEAINIIYIIVGTIQGKSQTQRILSETEIHTCCTVVWVILIH